MTVGGSQLYTTLVVVFSLDAASPISGARCMNDCGRPLNLVHGRVKFSGRGDLGLHP